MKIKHIYFKDSDIAMARSFFRKSKSPKKTKKASQDSVDHLHLKEKQSVTVCSFDNNDAFPAKNSQA